MKLGKVKPTATVVAQFAAGLEVEAIQHEGKIFLPVISMGGFMESSPTSETTKPAPKKVEKKVVVEDEDEVEESTTNTYTEDELIEKPVKELTKILKTEFDIDPADYPGKNTNKKLRELILNALGDEDAEDASDEEDDDVVDDVEDTVEVDEGLVTEVVKVLEDFDSGSLNKKKAITKLTGLVKNSDKDAVAGLVDTFEEDETIEIDEIAERIAEVLSGATVDDEEDEAPAKPKRGKKAKATEELVDVEDLEKGDKVSVYWDGEEFDDWYDGEVKSVKKTRKGLNVVIAYEDDTEDAIDPAIHTKIKRLD